jgi:retinol-binding protein 3
MKKKNFSLLVIVFLCCQVQAQFSCKDKAATVDSIASILERKYVFPDLAKQFNLAIRESLKQKRYDTISSAASFASFVTADMQQIIKDRHLGLRYEPLSAASAAQVRKNSDDGKAFEQLLLKENYGIKALSVLPGNIGYIDFTFFYDPEFAGDTYVAMMNYIAHTDALIIDLRNCNGSMPDFIPLLCSYFFKNPAHLNDFYLREGNRTTQSWTHKTVQGKKYLDKPIYILTSSRTFSGAEELAYDLKNLKRAVIIGEVTGGGANPGISVRVNQFFTMFVPFGRAISPVTKTNWEGVGVTPDTMIKANRALHKAQMIALQYLAEKYKGDAKWKGYLNEQIGQLEKKAPVFAKQTFALAGFENAREVAVVGSFNNWSPKADKLQRKGTVWITDVEAEPGKHTYKFIVDGRWILDPGNPNKVKEGGYENSLTEVKTPVQ